MDNSPASCVRAVVGIDARSYIFHPRNALPVSSWFNDPHDSELTDLANVLTDLAHVDDVRGALVIVSRSLTHTGVLDVWLSEP